MAADSCCPVLWYCVGGVVKSYPVGPAPPAGYGRWYPTAAAALAVCGGGGSGSGSGGGGGSGAGGTISSACCPSNLLPATLTGTFSNKTGAAVANLPTSAAFTWNGSGWNWSAGVVCGGVAGSLLLTCSGGTWAISTGASVLAPNISPAPTSAACSPFAVVFDVTWNGGPCGAMSYRVTFTQ